MIWMISSTIVFAAGEGVPLSHQCSAWGSRSSHERARPARVRGFALDRMKYFRHPQHEGDFRF